MKTKLMRMLVLITILITFTNCELVEGIFKAGVGVGIFIVIAVIAAIIYVISRFGKK
ncbi:MULTISPECIES: hypothetical protein [unclassified Flavobacterium]|uniref:hypothetical protein n=1 Tax=unclassified Flavobacterium TaxID=196869 RepID=UPI0025B82A97|nr:MULTISPECIES: hypothetical protein [unclassified Flavobacterium]